MKVEIWSDIVCPWCYLGRRWFEKALSRFDHRQEVEVIWRSFELDPEAPLEYPGNVNEMLAEKYGISLKQAAAKNAQIEALAAAEGLEYHLDRAHPVNSMEAHRLIHLAAQHDLQSEMKERLQRAYFTEGLLVNDHSVLIRLAEEVGLDVEETRTLLKGKDLLDAVRADEHRARVLNITGVPFFLIDEKIGVSGAQSSEVFHSALKRAWSASHQGE
jgi:predicted DsbA family dithiol-disulfide isomerase